jgi:hypothetical protein
MKKSTLAAGLKAAAEQKPHTVAELAPEANPTPKTKARQEKTVLIGAHFPPEVLPCAGRAGECRKRPQAATRRGH